MKKTSIIIILCIILLVCGCTSQKEASVVKPKEITAEMQTYTFETFNAWKADTGGYKGVLEKYVTEPDSEFTAEVPVYAENELLFNYHSSIDLPRDGSIYYDSGGLPTNTDGILFKYPTCAIRQRDKDTIYLSYDMDTGYRLFLFLHGGKMDCIAYGGYPLIVGTLNSYRDYEKLHIGSPIEDLEKIDPIATIYKRYILDFWKWEPVSIKASIANNTPIASVHYLKDGLLQISYTMEESGKLIIYDIQYSKDRVIPDRWGNPVDYTILDKDLPY